MGTKLGRQAASQAAAEAGWQFVLGAFETWVPAAGLGEAVGIANVAAPVAADLDLRLDLRDTGVGLRLIDSSAGWVDQRHIDAARTITERLRDHGWEVASAGTRPVQRLELAIDTLDEEGIRPFWQAALDYEVDSDGSLFDPRGQGPLVWFQTMDAPRPQRNRIHFDLTVPHSIADARIAAALSAGGRMVNDAWARSFWVLADPEGNEICICTWQDRDERRDGLLPIPG